MRIDVETMAASMRPPAAPFLFLEELEMLEVWRETMSATDIESVFPEMRK